MLREDLVRLCDPNSPEEALEGLRSLYNDLANSVGWVKEEDLKALNAGIAVMKGCIEES